MQYKVTVWQRAVMWLMTCHKSLLPDIDLDKVPNVQVWFTRRSIEHALWFEWQSYHAQKMKELVELGWVASKVTPQGVIAYRLTDEAKTVMIGTAAAVTANLHLAQRKNGRKPLPGVDEGSIE